MTRLLTRLITWKARHDDRRRDRLDPEAGLVIIEDLGLTTVAVIAIVAIGSALQALGVDIIGYVRSQLGV
jgi:hypothetical protein